ncbi:hypothetical protein CWATWH8502_2445 [Crocosphaera watsonii WH 8502]|uniref:Uncharacterized protein n=1 Tax=Crocosphaera watsonii WH 8502 TaxID=423474 RepID=T2I8T3_CROWT|nr:hypothetical protein CWATWH8502_2445 [Crocosphaera watsonii WH 8502]
MVAMQKMNNLLLYHEKTFARGLLILKGKMLKSWKPLL